MYRVGIIGCGVELPAHTEAFPNANIDAKIVALADTNVAALESAGKRFGCDTYIDYTEMLKRDDIDVVHIITPHFLHAEMAINAMKAGKNVFTEKPISITVSDAERMLLISRDTGKRVAVCYQNRYREDAERTKEILESGKCGKVKGIRVLFTWNRTAEYYNSAAWRGTWKYEGGGVLINQAVHVIDMITWFFGSPSKIKAHFDTRCLKDCIEVEDTADATMWYDDGKVLVLYATNCYSSSPDPLIEIDCENCYIRMSGDCSIQWINGRKEYIKGGDNWCAGDISKGEIYHTHAIQDFYDALKNGKPCRIDGENCILTNRIVEACYKSCFNNECIVMGGK